MLVPEPPGILMMTGGSGLNTSIHLSYLLRHSLTGGGAASGGGKSEGVELHSAVGKDHFATFARRVPCRICPTLPHPRLEQSWCSPLPPDPRDRAASDDARVRATRGRFGASLSRAHAGRSTRAAEHGVSLRAVQLDQPTGVRTQRAPAPTSACVCALLSARTGFKTPRH